MHHQDDQPTFEFPPIPAPHTFDLLGNIGSIDHGQFARPQKAHLLTVQA
jgi:hypothetical protein